MARDLVMWSCRQGSRVQCCTTALLCKAHDCSSYCKAICLGACNTHRFCFVNNGWVLDAVISFVRCLLYLLLRMVFEHQLLSCCADLGAVCLLCMQAHTTCAVCISGHGTCFVYGLVLTILRTGSDQQLVLTIVGESWWCCIK